MFFNSLMIILLILTISKLEGQNLVPNPCFEDTLNCYVNYSSILAASGWFSAQLSPDYYSDISTCSGVTTTNNLGGYQIPHFGVAYVGQFFYQASSLDTCLREYISIRLSQPLDTNKKYCVEYFVSRADKFSQAVSRFGAYLSTDTAYNNNFPCNLLYNPQVSITFPIPLQDSANWVSISGSFISQGGEEFITIGNFYDDDSTAIDTIWGLYSGGYYYIDDVSVILCDSLTSIKDETLQIAFKQYPNPVIDFLTIESSKWLEKTISISVLNTQGQLVLPITSLQPRQTIIPTSEIEAGIYFYLIKKGATIISSGKFVKL